MLTLGSKPAFICIADTEKHIYISLYISNNYIYNFTTALLKFFYSISDFVLFLRLVYLKSAEFHQGWKMSLRYTGILLAEAAEAARTLPDLSSIARAHKQEGEN